MEYIEKKDEIFYAKKGEVKIDNKNIFTSRCNYHGASGLKVLFSINGFLIEWLSNFGYGSWSYGYATVKYKGVEIRRYRDIETTKSFVDILNKYVCIQEEEKEVIMIELANLIAHCSKELCDRDEYTSISLDELKTNGGLLYIYNNIVAMKAKINELEEKIERLNAKSNQIV